MAWSWILTITSLYGVYLVGKKSSNGWVVGFFVQFLWLAYALVTSQYGFIVSAVAFGAMYVKNWREWKQRDPQIDRPEPGNHHPDRSLAG